MSAHNDEKNDTGEAKEEAPKKSKMISKGYDAARKIRPNEDDVSSAN